MEHYRNPFAIRASEKIESDETFIQLFSSEPLSLLLNRAKEDKLWNNVNYILSSPGAGKTTMLRFFSPSILRKITEKNKELYNKLRSLDVKQENRIVRCAAYLQIGRDYSFLEDDDLFSKSEQKRIYFALLNARIVLVSLKSLMNLSGLNYRELSKIQYIPNEHYTEFRELPLTCTCQDLLDWAGRQEKYICEILDSYEKMPPSILGSNSLFALSAMNAKWFTYEGKTLCDEFIFQFDDAHKFTQSQKYLLRDEIVSKRINATLWIAERLEALTTSEMLDDTNFEERDYGIIRLDGSLPKSSFNTMAKAIATRRSKYSLSDVELMESLSNDLYDNSELLYKKAVEKYIKKIRHYETASNYISWIDTISKKKSTRDKAIYFRSLLMYLGRKKETLEVFQLFLPTPEEMEGSLSPLMALAEQIFISENMIPQYYGSQTLIDLSSFNVEQFLNFSSVIYDRLLSKKIINPLQYDLSAKEQHDIIVSECKVMHDGIRKYPKGNILIHFIDNVINFCAKETFTDSYSYQTVSGFAINEENISYRNSKDGFWFQDEQFNKLTEILRLCLAFNLLERNTIVQGKKDQKWSVFSLNRWLCVYANLPLYRGGWRKLSLVDINKWLNEE